MINIPEDGQNRYFPIACNLNYRQCVEDGLYQFLIPNDDRPSILYFEESGASNRISKPLFRNSAKVIKGTEQNLKLFVFANNLKIGYTQCDIRNLLYNDILNALDCKEFKTYTDSIFVEVLGLDACETTHKLFQRYSYDCVEQFFIFPYTVMTINIKITYSGKDCGNTLLQCPEPIECISYDNL